MKKQNNKKALNQVRDMVAMFIVLCLVFFFIISLSTVIFSFGVSLWVKTAEFYGYTPWGFFRVVVVSSACLASCALFYKIMK